jgi:hypothetical protein
MYNVRPLPVVTAWLLRVVLRMTTILFVFAFIAPADAGQTLFYTGDPNNQESIGDYYDPLGGPLPLSQIFEPFTVTSSGWEINSVFFTELDLAPYPISSAEWSIRYGMAPGLGGVKIAGGMSQTAGESGTTTLMVSGLDVILAPGTYWLNITPNSETGRLFADATSGENSIDADLQGAALWYEPGVQHCSPTNLDFSAGATGEIVPEPSMFWLFLGTSGACGVARIYRRRRYS